LIRPTTTRLAHRTRWKAISYQFSAISSRLSALGSRSAAIGGRSGRAGVVEAGSSRSLDVYPRFAACRGAAGCAVAALDFVHCGGSRMSRLRLNAVPVVITLFGNRTALSQPNRRLPTLSVPSVATWRRSTNRYDVPGLRRIAKAVLQTIACFITG
jgi:hypothetical protein